MRCVVPACLIVLLSPCPFAAISHANVPSPATSEVTLSGQSQDCQYRFGVGTSSADVLIAELVLRNSFNLPVVSCAVSIELVPNDDTVEFCSCCPAIAEGITDTNGFFQATFSSIGGYGSLDVVTHSHCIGNVLISVDTIEFTSQDLNASCEAAGSTNLFDLARFGAALAPSYETYGDYDCSATVNVLDLGFFANGLGVGCGQAACP